MPLIARSKWVISVATTLALLLIFTFKLTPPTLASGGLTQLSSDPYSNKSSQHQTEVEPDNYSYGSTIVNAFQVGRFAGGGSDNVGWATSTDGGNTWSNGYLPGTTVYATPPGKYARVSDPAVAYDAAHNTWLISILAIMGNPSPAVLVSSSTDGGLTWNNPVPVISTKHAKLDKDWIVCDNTASSTFYGHCYVEWDNNGNGNLIQMSTSSDGGSTWGAPKTTANHADGIGGQPVVQPNGNVVVPIGNAIDDHILAFTSHDGGASWTSTIRVSSANTYFENANIRNGPLPSAEIDGSGKIYVVWQDCRFEPHCNSNDLVMSSSSDGISWSTVQRIPIGPVGSRVDHFIPGLAVDKTTSGSSAHLGLTYYYMPAANCNTPNCKLYVGFISSTNGGSTWSTPLTITGPMSLLWLANTDLGRMVGDYISTTITSGKAFPVYAAATAPQNGVYKEAIYSVTGGLDVVGGTFSSRGDHVVVAENNSGRSGVRTFN